MNALRLKLGTLLSDGNYITNFCKICTQGCLGPMQHCHRCDSMVRLCEHLAALASETLCSDLSRYPCKSAAACTCQRRLH